MGQYEAPTIRLASSDTAMCETRRDRAFARSAEELGPTVRLASADTGMRESPRDAALHLHEPPTVRLAVGSLGGGGQSVRTHSRGDAALAPVDQGPTVRLAHGPGAQGDNVLLGQRGVERLPESSFPALLVSYFYIKPFLAKREKYAYRDWVLDSGAFSAANSGATIDLNAYIDFCKEVITTDPKLTEVFGLDVIGDWRQTRANIEKMWAAGVPAIPTFHAGQPWDVLKGMARDYNKIAIGGGVGLVAAHKLEWVGQCFSRVWPARIHGFGMSSETMIMRYPFHSVDATNWELGPCKFGSWKAFGQMSVRGSSHNLRAEVEWYLALERKARSRWRGEMAKLDAARGPMPSLRTPLTMENVPPTVRFAYNPQPAALASLVALKAEADAEVDTSGPSVRLVHNPNLGCQKALAPQEGPAVRLAYHPEGSRTLADMGNESKE